MEPGDIAQWVTIAGLVLGLLFQGRQAHRERDEEREDAVAWKTEVVSDIKALQAWKVDARQTSVELFNILRVIDRRLSRIEGKLGVPGDE